MNIHDAISPTAYTFARIFGYGLFFVVIVVVIAAICRMYVEGETAYNRYRKGY